MFLVHTNQNRHQLVLFDGYAVVVFLDVDDLDDAGGARRLQVARIFVVAPLFVSSAPIKVTFLTLGD